MVRAGKTFPFEGQILGILAPADTVSVIEPVEQNVPALIGAVESVAGKMNTKYAFAGLQDHRWLNPHFTTRILRLDEGPSAAEVSVRYDDEVLDGGKVRVECSQCAEEKITLLVRNSAILELFKRKKQVLCSQLASAFRIHGRMYFFATASGCDTGYYVATVLDVSGSNPQTVF